MTTATPAIKVGTNCDLALKFDPNEGLPSGVPREMGFFLRKTQQGPKDYQAYDDASRAIVELVRAKGFHIDPQTLEVTFEKDDWSGPFGAYQERPGGGRPAFTIGVDHRKRHPVLAPRRYTAGVGSGQAAFPAGISGEEEFNGASYVCIAGRKVYKLTWAVGTAYFTEVFEHSDASAVLRDLKVYDNVLYVAAGETAAYAYSTDGAAWTESNRGDPYDKAEQFMILNGWLHKTRVPAATPNLHSQTTDGTNGGAAWASDDSMGDSTGTIQMMVAQLNAAVFATDAGLFNLDSQGNPTEIYPELQTLRESGNGWHAFVWHNDVYYPTLHGELFTWKDGRMYSAAPAHKMERMLEVTPARDAVFVGQIRAMVGTQDYLYAEIQRASDSLHRILVLEQEGLVWLWRTLFDLPTTTSDELWITSESSSGPVLWASTSDDMDYKASYWLLPAGPDPLQDARVRYASTGRLVEPWLDMGCPTTPKRWNAVELEAYAGSDCEIIVEAVGEDGSRGMKQTVTVDEAGVSARLRFVKGFHTLRCRLEFTLISDDATETPVLISYRVSAFAMPEPIRMWEWTAAVPASGPSAGLYQQKQMRTFLDEIRRAEYPLEFTDMFGDPWPVVVIPPPPIESAGPQKQRGRLDESYHIALIEQVTREWEIQHPPDDDDDPPGEDPVLPPDEEWPPIPDVGRVYIAARQVTTSNIVLGVTQDFSADSPAWTAISTTGLPTASADTMTLRLNPYARDGVGSTKAVLLLKNGSDWELYQIANIQDTTLSWTKILDQTIAETVWTPNCGTPYTFSMGGAFFHDGVLYTIAQEDRLVILVDFSGTAGSGVTNERDRLVFISDDDGTTWRVGAEVPPAHEAVGNEYGTPLMSLVIGQHNADVLITHSYPTGGSTTRKYAISLDAGVSAWTIRSSPSPSNDGGPMWGPYQANEAEDVCYVVTGSEFRRTWDKWVSSEQPTIQEGDLGVVSPLQFDLLDSQTAVWGFISYLRFTNDGFATMTSTGSGNWPTNRNCIAQVGQGWIFANPHSATQNGPKAWLSEDWISTTEKTGDLVTLLGAEATPDTLVPDLWQ